MGIFDFNNIKKARQESRHNDEQERMRFADEQKVKHQEQLRSFDAILSNFNFDSNCHQRYEGENPVGELQICHRYIKIRKNITGCSGYQLANGDGYILTTTNGDTGRPQFAQKPMRVVKFSDTEILLQGYMVSAQTPFGWQDIDLSDYGFSIILNNKKTDKCILYMYDRNVRLEYMINK